MKNVAQLVFKPAAYNNFNNTYEDDYLKYLIVFIDMICSVPDELMAVRLKFALFDRSGVVMIYRQ